MRLMSSSVDVNDLWVLWTGSGSVHLADSSVKVSEVRGGGIPLACGRFAPEREEARTHLVWDLDGHRRCGTCAKIQGSRG